MELGKVTFQMEDKNIFPNRRQVTIATSPLKGFSNIYIHADLRKKNLENVACVLSPYSNNLEIMKFCFFRFFP